MNFPPSGWWTKPAVAAYGLLLYLGKTLWPAGLSVLYPFPEGFPARLPFEYLVSPIAVIILAAIFWKFCRRNKTLVFGAGFFCCFLVPMLQWVPVEPGVAMEHITYLASIGLSLALAEIFFIALGKYSRLAPAFTAAVVITLCLLTFARSKVWHDSVSLWTDRLEKYPDSHLAYVNRALAQKELGRTDLALSDLDKAIKLNPNFRAAYLRRGQIYYSEKNHAAALADADYALSLTFGAADNPDSSKIASEAYHLKGAVSLERGELKKALRFFDSALAAEPDYWPALMGKGCVYLKFGEFDSAIENLSLALKYAPYAPDLQNALGAAWAQKGDCRKAAGYFGQALRLRPDYAEAALNLAAALFNCQDYAAARSAAAQAEKLGAKIDPAFLKLLYAVDSRSQDVRK